MGEIKNNMVWMSNEHTRQYVLRKVSNRRSVVVCGLHPKSTYEYLEYLGILFFEDKNMFLDWYREPSFWYDDTAPCDVSKKLAINRMIRMIYGDYI